MIKKIFLMPLFLLIVACTANLQEYSATKTIEDIKSSRWVGTILVCDGFWNKGWYVVGYYNIHNQTPYKDEYPQGIITEIIQAEEDLWFIHTEDGSFSLRTDSENKCEYYSNE